MAWLAFATDGSESCAVYMMQEEAQAAADAWGWQIMPLYLAARLTDAEREAVQAAATFADEDGWLMTEQIATLRGLLARMSGEAALSYSGQSPSTPLADTTPDECSVPTEWTSKPYWVDPPSGHRYGFPRLYDPATDGDMRAWMIRQGYPEHLARQDLPCTFTASTEDCGK
jgi:hypothetical protein